MAGMCRNGQNMAGAITGKCTIYIHVNVFKRVRSPMSVVFIQTWPD